MSARSMTSGRSRARSVPRSDFAAPTRNSCDGAGRDRSRGSMTVAGVIAVVAVDHRIRHGGMTDRCGARRYRKVVVEAELHTGVDGETARRLGQLADFARGPLPEIGPGPGLPAQ